MFEVGDIAGRYRGAPGSGDGGDLAIGLQDRPAFGPAPLFLMRPAHLARPGGPVNTMS